MTQRYYSDEIGLPPSDRSLWRLRVSELGASKWEFLTEEQARNDPQKNSTKYHLKMDTFEPPAAEESIVFPIDAAKKGAEFFSLLQEESGVVLHQYIGPMFMTTGWVFSSYFTNSPINPVVKHEFIRYIVNNAHPVDGGWGLHTVDKSTCFGTTINYVLLRLLGLEKDHPVCVKARATLHKLGGAIGLPHWGKAWLALLNLFGWEGVNPAPPELWMLPYSMFIHPGRWWVHTRCIYLPLAYLSANRSTCKLDPLLEEIRSEIYLPRQLPYESIDFSKHRNTVCGVDLYYPHSRTLDTLNWVVCKYEKYLRPDWLLKKSSKAVYELIKKECANSDYLCIAPVSFAFNMIVTYLEEGPDSYAFSRFMERREDVIFHGPLGMAVMGTNGGQVWDTAFMCQYLIMAGLETDPKFHDMIMRGYHFLRRSQFTDECVDGSFRDKRKGAWPFSTKTQGYTVSDCTAEAMKAILMIENNDSLGKYIPMEDRIARKDLEDAVERILFIQNTGSFEFGSFSSYEQIRATPALECLSPAEVFNNIMVEYPYVECTDSSVFGLVSFSTYHPDYKPEIILKSIDTAIAYIEDAQDKFDGSWYGSWGICYTYAAMFAVEALETVGKVYSTSEHVKKGLDFLISKQEEDGGWSESMKSCETHTYIPTGQTQVVQTAWATIALILGEYPDRRPIDKAIQLIMERQSLHGEWNFEYIEGVFNHSCAIEYPTYRFLFPIKALGLYARRFGGNAVPGGKIFLE
ncbi:hypothetical protein PUMCH_002577 [Australozyma saopauloensis]|uniref:Terpene cyclase/mutase family member n=1 Tax=Australozyma saopauloensis TaxID=291208 RepID=A0AAX4HAB8_9ASCO|nr:hypothetical protein PUMCH_002577 [[Candida] saopauloensis]